MLGSIGSMFGGGGGMSGGNDSGSAYSGSDGTVTIGGASAGGINMGSSGGLALNQNTLLVIGGLLLFGWLVSRKKK